MTNESTTVTANNLGAFTQLLNCLPIALRDGNSIIIHNLPADLTYETLGETPIISICHQMKHLYADGDRIGRKGIVEKLANQKRLENNAIRMCISYTYSLRKESNKNNLVATINFVPSYTKDHPPRFISHINNSELTLEKIEKLRNSDQAVSVTHNGITVERKMDHSEVDEQMDIFIGTCREEISSYLQEVISVAFAKATALAMKKLATPA